MYAHLASLVSRPSHRPPSKTGCYEGLCVRLTICLFTLGLHTAHTLQELFYLLADAESSSEHEGGVVTTSSLAVELQAGGLTPVRMGA